MQLLLATGNSHKVREITAILEEHLGEAFEELQILNTGALPPHVPPEEDGATFEENAFKKASFYAKLAHTITLADDSGLQVEALNGRPGLFSSRYAATNEERIRKILAEMKNVPEVNRHARFICAAVLMHPGGAWTARTGYCAGSIAFSPRGTQGFGFDPVFMIPETGKTMAELTMNEKNHISHRSRAIIQLIPLIQKLVDLALEENHNKVFELFDTI